MKRIILITLIVLSAIMLIGCYCERVGVLRSTTKTKNYRDFELKIRNTREGKIIGMPAGGTGFPDSLSSCFFYYVGLLDLNKGSHVTINYINVYGKDEEQYSCRYFCRTYGEIIEKHMINKQYFSTLPFSLSDSIMGNVTEVDIYTVVEKNYDSLNVFYIDFNIEIDSVEYAHKVKYKRKTRFECRPKIF